MLVMKLYLKKINIIIVIGVINLKMSCYVSLNENNDLDAICPACKKYGYQLLDYSEDCSIPMIHCWDCGFHAVLNLKRDFLLYLTNFCPIYYKYSIFEKQLYDLYVETIKTKEPKNIQKIYTIKQWFKIDLLKVKRILNEDLFKYHSDKKLSQEDVKRIIESDFDGNIIAKLKLTENKEIEDKKIDKKLFNISLECNSYNINQPVNPYPENFDLSYDGRVIYIEVEHQHQLEYHKYSSG